MAAPSFITRLNWRLILLNFVACWFFAYGFQSLSFLHDLKMDRWAAKHYAYHSLDYHNFPENFSRRIASLAIWTTFSPTVGGLTAFLIALTIVLKKRWFWFNSFMAFMAVILLIWFKVSGWRWLKYVFLTPGDLFYHFSAGYFITNGTILIVLGILCLFLPAANRFIEGGFRQKTENMAPLAEADNNETN